MEDVINYIANDARCQIAIEELKAGMDTLKWLGEYLVLYETVTYGPSDLPRIIDCNYQGVVYKGIRQFARLYIQTHLGHKDPFSNPEEDNWE
jgi:hypothetical protein